MTLRHALLSLALLAAAVAGPATAEERLIRADGQGVTFEVTTAGGATALAPRTVWIAVPVGHTVEVASAVIEAASLEGLHAGPAVFGLTTAAALDEFATAAGAPERGLALEAVVATMSPPGAVHARLLGVTGLRGLQVAAIEIRPALEDGAGGRLRVATRLAVDCAFVPLAGATAPAAVPPRSSVFAGIERALLLNADDADAFRPRARPGQIAATHRNGEEPLYAPVEVRVARTGIQEITGADLEPLFADYYWQDPANFRLFRRPGLPLLSEDEIGTAYERTEVALRIDDGGDGVLDADDRILFYGQGPSGWFDEYGAPGADPLEWLQNPYETHNVYMLALNPLPGAPPARWTTRDAAPVRPGATSVEHVRARMHFEEDRAYYPDSNEPERTWNPWVWTHVGDYSGLTETPLHVDGLVPGSTARLRMRFWGRRGVSYDPNPFRLDVRLNGQPVGYRTWTGTAPQVLDTTGTWLVEGGNRLGLLLAHSPLPGSQRDGFLMACDLVFDRRLLAVGDTLEFTAPDAAKDRAYAVAPFSSTSGLIVLDVSDPLHPVELIGWTATDTTGGEAVHFHDASPGPRYSLAAATARRRPALSRATRWDLRTGGADYLVIHSDALEGAALNLAGHRQQVAPPFPGATTRTVRVSDIFAAYSGGRMDPAAIRNFLYDVVNGGSWSPAPTFVCLLGDATFDAQDNFHLGSDLGRTQVPTFQRNFAGLGQYSTDDWLADVDIGSTSPGPGPVPDLIVGRLPAATVTEAETLVEKVRQYDWAGYSDPFPNQRDWRNRLLWLVDDASQGTQPDPLGSTFTTNVEELDRNHLPAWLERHKVNLLEYSLVGGTEKPAARQATIDQLRRGALVWFYVGRGNPFLLADERAFRLSDMAGLDNGSRRPFFVANTSSVGPFDSPIFTTLGEAMVKDPDGGSIATYSATGEAFASSGFNLSKALLDALFAPEGLAAGRTIGEATFLAATRGGGSANDRKFQLLGDPGTRLASARYDVRIALFDDETGEALVDSLPRGRVLRIEAEVHRTRDSLVVALADDFTGDATFRLMDSPPHLPIPPDPFGPPDPTYVGNPREVARALVGVVGGRGTTRLFVPPAATPGPAARVLAFVQGNTGRASGTRDFRLGGAHADPADVSGPEIHVRLDGIHGPTENYDVTFTDPSGIRTLVDSTRHRVTISIDGAPPVDVTARVQAYPGRHDVAYLIDVFRDLSDGMHTVRIEASDNLAVTDADVAHRSSAEFPLRVAAAVATLEERAITMPNPFSRTAGTTVVFTGLRGGSHDTATLVIHDVRGRRLRTLEARSNIDTIQLPWDGRDEAGRALPAGVYPWRAVLSLDGGIAKEYSGRLVLLD